MRFAAYTISILFHPVLVPLFTLLLFFQLDPFLLDLIPSEARWRIILAVGITTGLLPALSVFLLYRAGLVNSLELKERKERLLPLTMTLFYFIATYFLLMKAMLPGIIYSAILAATVAIAGLILISLFQKVSVHLCGFGSLIGSLLGLYSRSPFPFVDLLILFVLLGGILAASRAYLEAHKLHELLVGLLWGFLVAFYFVSRDIYYMNPELF